MSPSELQPVEPMDVVALFALERQVLSTFVHAMPHSLRDTEAASGTSVRLDICGPAGGVWLAIRTEAGWKLGRDRDGPADATVTLHQDLAWRLCTKAVSRKEALKYARLVGNVPLGERVLHMTSIIA